MPSDLSREQELAELISFVQRQYELQRLDVAKGQIAKMVRALFPLTSGNVVRIEREFNTVAAQAETRFDASRFIAGVESYLTAIFGRQR